MVPGDDFLVVEPQDAAGVPQVQVGDPPRGAAENDGAGGAVVRQRVRKSDRPVLDPGVDDLDGRQRVVDGVDDVGDGGVPAAEAPAQDKCRLEFHEGLR